MKQYIGIIKIVALLIFMPLVLGKCAFSKTFKLYNEYRDIQTLEKQLQHTVSTFNQISPPAAPDNENIISNGRVMELMNQVCEKNSVAVKQYEPTLSDTEGDYKLYTANLILAGTYIDLVQTLQYCEKNIQSIKISTLKFEYDEKRMKDGKVEMVVEMKQIEKL